MPATTISTNPFDQIGRTRCCADHDRDLVHELDHRLDAVWRYDQYITNAEGHATLESFWRELKQQDLANVDRLKQLLVGEIKGGCF